MGISQKLRRSQNEAPGWKHLRGKRHLGDRTSSTASVCYRASKNQLSAQDLEAFPEAIHCILNWLDRLASAVTRHRETPEYQEAQRKSGVAHRESGLTVREQETRTAVRNAKFAIRTARDLDRRWNARTLTYRNWHLGWYHWDLLNAYWDGSLQRRLEELLSQARADPMCRTPVQPGQL